MRHLLCACVFVPLRCYTILFPKAEVKAIDFSDQLLIQFNNKHGKTNEKDEKRMINHAYTYQGKGFFLKKKSFHLASSLLLKELKLTQMIESKGLKKKYPKTWSRETYRFLWNMSR